MGKGMRAGKKPSMGGGGGSMQKQLQQMQAMQRKMEMLQDLIMVAVNEGIRQIEELANNEMGKLTGGLNIPGLL